MGTQKSGTFERPDSLIGCQPVGGLSSCISWPKESSGLFDYMIGMEAAALAWPGAFLLFLATYGPILFRPPLGKA